MIKKIGLLSISLSLMATTALAQVPKDTILASEYYQKADSLSIDKKHEKSIDFFTKALLIYEKAETWEKVASCYNKISENRWRKDENEESLLTAKKAREICVKYLKNSIEEAIAYDNIGVCYQYVSDYETALKNYNKALTIKQKIIPKPQKEISVSYTNIGTIFLIKGEYEKALLFQKKALSLQKKTFGYGHKKVSYTYNEIGRVYISKKEYEKASHYFKKALTIFSNNNNLNAEAAASLNNIGVALRGKKEYNKSLEYYNKALNIYLKIYGKDHVRVSNSYYNIGLIHHDLTEYDKALEYYKKALSIRLNKLGENHSYVANSYLLIGWSYYMKQEYKKSLINYRKSLDISLNFSSPNPTMIATLYLFIGDVFNKEGEYQEALNYYQLALKANTSLNKIHDKINEDKANQFFDINIALEILLSEAKALQNLYQQDNNIKDLTNSINIYKKADKLIHKIRRDLDNRKDKIEFAKVTKEVYAEAIKTELLFNTFQKKQNHLDDMFYYVEQSKANILKELLNNSSALSFSGLSVELIELERNLKTDLSFYQSRVNKELYKKQIDTLKINRYESKLFNINRKQDSLTKVLEKEYPKYHQLKYKNDVISVTEIQEKLNNKTTVLEFFTTDSITYVFIISKNAIAIKELATPNLSKKVEKLRQSITSENIGDYNKSAYGFNEELIEPIKDKLVGDQLIIIPDGPLWHLNFDLLLTKKNTKADARNLPYLLRDYAISYGNSANVLFNSFKDRSSLPKTQNECLAFSFSDSTELTNVKTMSLATLRDTKDDLPGTRKEIKSISNIVNGQYFYGSEAVESNFKQNAGQYSILHLALHGDVDHKNPQNSKLYFTKSNDTVEDNLLYSHELFALDIPAELAVLSACNTGAGKIAKGEGIMSLGNAFQYAGTKSLLLSAWEVSDKSAPMLIENFYKNLASGMNKAKALQQAKLSFIKTADFEQVTPFYWGSFYVLGNADPIDIDQPLEINTYWIVLVGILIIFILGFVYYKKTVPSEPRL